MRSLLAQGLPGVSVAAVFAAGVLLISPGGPLKAQMHSPSTPNPSPPALGGSYASQGMSRPLGGVAFPSFPGTSRTRTAVKSTGARYFGPVYYVPNAFDSYYDYPQAPPLPPTPEYAPQPSAPVIINQYFGTRNGREAVVQSDENGAETTFQSPAPEEPKYYLIAYKDHSVYSALAYWLEDRTLHYVTTQNTHNQASLDLIDLDQTKKLNAGRDMPFSLPGK